MQLVLQDFARLATSRHGIKVNIGKGGIASAVRISREDRRLVFKHQLQELILDILAPERNPVVLLEMFDFVSRIYRPDRAVSLATRAYCRASSGGGMVSGRIWLVVILIVVALILGDVIVVKL